MNVARLQMQFLYFVVASAEEEARGSTMTRPCRFAQREVYSLSVLSGALEVVIRGTTLQLQQESESICARTIACPCTLLTAAGVNLSEVMSRC